MHLLRFFAGICFARCAASARAYFIALAKDKRAKDGASTTTTVRTTTPSAAYITREGRCKHRLDNRNWECGHRFLASVPLPSLSLPAVSMPNPSKRPKGFPQHVFKSCHPLMPGLISSQPSRPSRVITPSHADSRNDPRATAAHRKLPPESKP